MDREPLDLSEFLGNHQTRENMASLPPIETPPTENKDPLALEGLRQSLSREVKPTEQAQVDSNFQTSVMTPLSADAIKNHYIHKAADVYKMIARAPVLAAGSYSVLLIKGIIDQAVPAAALNSVGTITPEYLISSIGSVAIAGLGMFIGETMIQKIFTPKTPRLGKKYSEMLEAAVKGHELGEKNFRLKDPLSKILFNQDGK